jgi:predicted membrane protein
MEVMDERNGGQNERWHGHGHGQIRRNMGRKSMVFGLLVLLAGFFLLLRNMDILSPQLSEIIFSWQMLLIAIGLINVVNDSKKGFGFVLIIIGGFFLVSEFIGWPVNFSRVFWPALIIFIGFYLIFGRQRLWRRKNYIVSQGEDTIEEIAVFGGRERKIHSQNLKGGEMVNVFGGSTIDFTPAKPSPEGAVLDVTFVFGGSTLIIPSDWNVNLEVFNLFGGFSDKRQMAQIDHDKRITIKGVCIFGGGEIKSY